MNISPSNFYVLHLWYLGNLLSPRYTGSLKLEDGGGVSPYYSHPWLSSGFTLSDDLPLVNKRHHPPDNLNYNSRRAVGAVDDALPDRWGEKVIRLIDKPEHLSIMEYLYYAGDERFGAFSVSSSASTYLPKQTSPLPVFADAQNFSEVAIRIDAAEPLGLLESKILTGSGSPLGGAKPKALISIAGAQWVIKFFNNEPIDAPMVEHAAMTLARKASITVAQTQVIKLTGFHAVAIKRFDRDKGKRINCLSAGTALRAATPQGQDP